MLKGVRPGPVAISKVEKFLDSKYLLAYIPGMSVNDRPIKERKPTQVRRLEIIEAGMRILTTEGARQFTADHLGKSVGITGGTIFRHFRSMDEILDAIVDQIEEIIFADFPPQSDEPLESLRQFFETRVKVISNQPAISKLLVSEGLIPNAKSEHRQKRLREFKRRSRRFVMDRLKDAHTKGLLACDVNPEEGGILVLGAIYAIGHMGLRSRGTRNMDGLAQRTWGMIERSLRKNV